MAGIWKLFSMYVLVEGAGGLTCVSISALIVDAHRILAHQELHHFQVFAVGAGAFNITSEKILFTALCFSIVVETCRTIPVER